MTRWFGMLATAALVRLLVPTGAWAADPNELMPCKLVIVKAPPAAGGNGMTKFVCKPPSGGSFALPSFSTGAALVSVNTIPAGTGVALGGSTCTGLGNPPGSKGYKCSLQPNQPVILIKEKLVKAVVKFDLPAIIGPSAHPYPGDVGISVYAQGFGVGDIKRYCARFGGPPPIKNDATQYKRKDAPAPTACSPSGAFLAEDGGLF